MGLMFPRVLENFAHKHTLPPLQGEGRGGAGWGWGELSCSVDPILTLAPLALSLKEREFFGLPCLADMTKSGEKIRGWRPRSTNNQWVANIATTPTSHAKTASQTHHKPLSHLLLCVLSCFSVRPLR